ncbi:MAG TPA: glycosyltransferase family 39 protein [Terracidiphilus sp.]|nr:glycosyltransferase family 39 protein [Terracidiphilus sp.]
MSQLEHRVTGRLTPRFIVFAALAVIAGAVLRFWMLHKFFEVSGDSQLYGDMAKSLLLNGVYAVHDNSAVLHATLIRLPGYPLFLAACFRLFGMENYFAPAVLQILIELAGCILLARFAARICPHPYRRSAAQATLWLACLCPFTAIYAAEPLTESLTVFCIALALWSVARFQYRGDWVSALAFTFAVTYAALLRPDGALLGVALVLPMIFWPAMHDRARRLILFNVAPRRILLVCLLLALAPFAAWTVRNARAFHVFQPLAPRYATDPGEETWPGWQRWTKTWCLDFVSTFQVYWNMPGAPLDINQLPSRAFDSIAQRNETAAIFSMYEANGEELSPEIDARFAQLANERIAAHPLRYYIVLPVGRVLDMTFRPRVENLPIDLDWWVYKHHHVETRFSWFYAGLNAFYVLLGVVGLFLRPRLWPWMLAYILLRAALLATIEAPEARYTVEFFPIFFATGGIALARLIRSGSHRTTLSVEAES